MTILVFGSTGQVASALKMALADQGVVFLDREACDLTQPDSVQAALERYQPRVIINAAAYTAVDRAEDEPELAYAINAEAPRVMAEYIEGLWRGGDRDPSPAAQDDNVNAAPTSVILSKAKDLDPNTPNTVILSDRGRARPKDLDPKNPRPYLIHLSTDFVFNGTRTFPYRPGDPTDPLGVYGESKLAGEHNVLTAAPERAMIIRTAWVYHEDGGNFVKTMLRLMAERDQLGVVNDQHGSPTYAGSIAEVITTIIAQNLFTPGIFHWTDTGDITWYDFAVAIQEEAVELGLLDQAITINPITTDDYPTPAERPAYSVLDCAKLTRLTGMEPAPWRENLHTMLTTLSA